MAINLLAVEQLLDLARDHIHELQGLDVNDADGIRMARSDRAEISRDLLRLADALSAASALVREEYWRTKDYSSPIPRIGEEMSRL